MKGLWAGGNILTFSMRQSMRPNTRSSGTFMAVRVEKGSSASSSGVLIACGCWRSHCLGSGGVTVSLWSPLCVHNSPGELLGFLPETCDSVLFSTQDWTCHTNTVPHILSHCSNQAMLVHNHYYWWFQYTQWQNQWENVKIKYFTFIWLFWTYLKWSQRFNYWCMFQISVSVFFQMWTSLETHTTSVCFKERIIDDHMGTCFINKMSTLSCRQSESVILYRITLVLLMWADLL